MAGISDILNTAQQGVTATNNLVKQMTGTLNNINGQFSSITTSISSIDAQLTAMEAAWTLYTSTIAVSGGTVVATSTGKFNRIGKTVFVNFTIAMSSGGAGSGFVTATLPVLANVPIAINQHVFAGRENLVVGKMLQGAVFASSAVGIFNYDNTYPGGNGFGLTMSGVYEAT